MRKVYPYDFTYHAYARGRWIGSRIMDVYQKEFRAINPNRLVSGQVPSFDELEVVFYLQGKRFSDGQIRVNDKIVSPHYILRNNDIITSKTHRHEMPVIGLPIKIVHEDDNILVVDKPPSIPVGFSRDVNSPNNSFLDAYLWKVSFQFVDSNFAKRI